MTSSSSSVLALLLLVLFAFFFVAAQCALPQSLIEDRNREWIAGMTKRISSSSQQEAQSSEQQQRSFFAKAPFFRSLGDAPLPNCTGYNCVKKGSQCVEDQMHQQGCSNSTVPCCALGLHCLNGTCQTDNYGADCSSSADCLAAVDGTQIAYCVNSTCTEMYNTNDYCESDDVCLSGSCVDGRCEGIAIGSHCNTALGVSATCVLGSACLQVGVSFGVCVKSAGVGDTCTDQYIATVPTCEPGLICATGNCAEFNSVPAGHSCDSASLLECEEGLACGAGFKCVNGSDFTGKTCAANSDCGTNSCSCSPYAGQNVCDAPSNATNCQSELADLYSCLTQNNCSYSVDSFPQPNRAPDSCTMRNCKSDYIATKICQCASTKYMAGNCLYDYYCSKLATWIIIVIIIAGVVLLVLVAICIFLCCRCCKRRKHYDQI